MLELLRRSHRYFIGGVVFIIGGVFVFYLGIGGVGKGSGGPTSGAIIQLGSRHYSIADLQRVRDDQERSLRESLGDAFDASAARQYLDQMSADRLIQRAVLASEAERVGLRASDDEVKALVRRSFGGAEGLDGNALRDYAVRRFGSEGRFVQEVRDDILFTKLLDLIDAGADVSDAEARDSVRTRLEEIRVSTVALDVEKPPPGVEPDDEAIEKVLREENERVRRFYDDHPDRYHVPERVRARHVLIRIEPGADEAQIAEAQKRIEAALARIQNGEDFAKVASDVSEDPGSKDRGGDLGLFPRGQMVPAFEEVAFSQKDGETSGVVRTDFGFHVIRTDAHEAAQDRSFDDAAREIAEELAGADRARELARETSDRLVAAVRSGETLEDAARAASVPVKTSEWVRRRQDGYLPDIGAAPQVVTAAFAASPEKPSVDRVFDLGTKLVMVQVIERRGPTDEELEKEVPAERKKLLEARRNELRGAWLKESRSRLLRDGDLVVDLTPLEGTS